MGDIVPPLYSTKILKKEASSRCIKWTKILNTSLVFSMVVCFICGFFIVYYCVPCASTKQVSHGDLVSSSNVTCFQPQIPAVALDVFSICNISFLDDGSHIQHIILQRIFDFSWTIEDINKSLPPFSEGGVIMFCNKLLLIIQQLEHDVQKAVKHVKELQESLKPKHRRRPPLYFKT